jgi:ubiquinone biosynthesis protein COQ4
VTDAALPAPISTRLQPGKALAALRRLLADKEDTVAVFEIMRALNGGSTAKAYARLLETAQGGRLAYQRAELSDRLKDTAWLESLPANSLGAAYLAFLRKNGFTPDGLVETSNVGAAPVEQQHPYAWFGRRTRDAHDLWHILTGYETDGLGEASLVAFSFAQTGGLGWALIALGVWTRAMRSGGRAQAQTIVEGYRIGRRAAWLQAEDYDRLLAEPLDAARRRLKLERPERYLATPPAQRNPWAIAA